MKQPRKKVREPIRLVFNNAKVAAQTAVAYCKN